MGTDSETMNGRCQCGDIKYRVTGPSIFVEYCHCESCRRSSGAPLVAWAAFAPSQFEIEVGNPTAYNSSETVVRTFCGRCGTSLTLVDQRFADEIYVSVVSLDEPESAPPDFHIWRSHRLTWLETSDKLPRYVKFKFDGILEE